MADLASLLREARPGSALFRRAEQLKRWQESETNKESPVLKNRERKINFTDGCVFLAACSAGDKEEVHRLLTKGADIDTANVDGLTALHQACIDDNLEMVEFLVEHGADINCGDNEGWTPLHATASCGFVSIAKFLIDSGANVAAVNNDGDLPLDIAESDEMEELLQGEINRQGIDCELARNEEENRMLEDANQWLNCGTIKEKPHPKTGATALHVAAAKGYVKVMSILMQAGSDLNAQDVDGWTPLHAASHWAQKEACELLVESLCDMTIKNFVGQTVFDVADPDLLKLLEELKRKQATLQREKSQTQAILDRNKTGPPPKRKTSVTRMSGTDRNIAINKDRSQERVQLLHDNKEEIIKEERKSPESSESEEESEESEESVSETEVEKKNKANKNEISRELLSNRQEIRAKQDEQNKNREPPKQAPTVPSKVSSDNEDELPSWRRVRKTDSSGSNQETNSNLPERSRRAELISQLIPVTRLPISSSSITATTTTATNTTTTLTCSNDKEQEPQKVDRRRPASLESDERYTKFGPFIGHNRFSRPNSLPDSMTVTTTTSVTMMFNTTTTFTRISSYCGTSPLISSPVMLRRKEENRELPKAAVTATVAVTTTTPTVVIPTPAVTTTTVTPGTPGTPSSAQVRRSFVPPVRDEESETQRKAHAKRVRETRRSTQGVTLDEIKSAEQLVKKQQEGKETAKPDITVTAPDSQESNSSLERRPSWRLRLEEDKNKDEGRRIRRPEVSSADETTTAAPTTPTYVRRPRLASADNDVAPFTTGAATVRSRPSRSEEDLRDHDNDADNRLSTNSVTNIQATQANILKRRRPKRRSTGVVYADGDDADSKDTKVNNPPTQNETADRGYRQQSRYGSSGSVGDASSNRSDTSSHLSDRLSRSSSINSTASQNDVGDKDYKKLYEDLKVENDRLQGKLTRSEKELEEIKQQMEKASQNAVRNSLSDADKREKRALERKVSEMEEELKLLEQLKLDNQRLRDENGALIRVISKLSK